jgi:hypothetical protein
MSLYREAECGHLVIFGDKCQQCRWDKEQQLDALIEELDDLREQLSAARAMNVQLRDALETAAYDLERIETRAWTAEQMRLGAKSGRFLAKRTLAALKALFDEEK